MPKLRSMPDKIYLVISVIYHDNGAHTQSINLYTSEGHAKAQRTVKKKQLARYGSDTGNSYCIIYEASPEWMLHLSSQEDGMQVILNQLESA